MTLALQTLVLKDGSAVDKTFELISPSAGYDSVAEWALKDGVISSVFPRITTSARNTKRTAGRVSSKAVQVKIRIPSSFTDAVTGLTNVGSAYEFNGTVSIPADFPEARKGDAVAFVTNAINHAMIKAMFTDGAPAT